MKFFKCILIIFCINNSLLLYAQDINIHGFFSQGYLKSDRDDFIAETSKGSFQFNEAGLMFSTDLNDQLHIGMQFFARRLGNLGNDSLMLDWVFADYRWQDWMGFRIGKMKTPFGLYNEIRDIDMLRTSIILPQSVYFESWREAFFSCKGLGVYGELLLDKMGRISYQLLGGEATVPTDGGIAHYIERHGYGDIEKFEDLNSIVANLVWNTPVNGLKFGGTYIKSGLNADAVSNNSFIWGKLRLASDIYNQIPQQLTDVLVNKNIDPAQASQIANNLTLNYFDAIPLSDSWPKSFSFGYDPLRFLLFSAEYSMNKLTIAGEYMEGRASDNRKLNEINMMMPVPSEIWYMEGYYASLAYRINDLIELGMYYSVYYFNRDDKDCIQFQQYNEDIFQHMTLDEIYSISTESIKQNFQLIINSDNQLGIIINDDDMSNINVKPNYQVIRNIYPDYGLYLKDLVFSARFDFSDVCTFKVEGHFMEGAEIVEIINTPEPANKTRFLFALKLTLNF